LRTLADDATAEQEYSQIYARDADPWAYEKRAVEVLKADRVCEVVASLVSNGAVVVEAGCATGHITRRLARLPIELVVFDLIPPAVQVAQQLVSDAKANARIEWCSASATRLPVARGASDLVLLLDGPLSWHLSPAALDAVLEEACAAVKPGGHVLIMDYLTPRRFGELRDPVRRSRLDIVAEHALPDRVSYVLESMVKALRGWSFIRWAIGSMALARFFARISAWFGEKGSKHLLLVCRPRSR